MLCANTTPRMAPADYPTSPSTDAVACTVHLADLVMVDVNTSRSAGRL